MTFGRRLAQLAAEQPDRTAIVFAPREGGERRVSRQELDRSSNRLARLLAARGAGEGSFVVVALPNCPEHIATALAVWKLGGCVLPLSAALPARERDALLELARPAVVVGDLVDLEAATALPDDPLPDRVSRPGKAIGSGGSTGRSKIIVDPYAWVRVPGEAAGPSGRAIGMRPGQVQLVAGPLYHNAPFCWSHWGLFDEHTLVLMERFDAGRAVELIRRHRVTWGFMVPTMLQRIAKLPGIGPDAFESVEALWHGAASCPPWLKRQWIELLGPERLYEPFGATEAVGVTLTRGDEWLAHPGSVGRPFMTDLRILDEEGREVPPGEVGEIFMRPAQALFGGEDEQGPPYEYIGAPPARATPDGLTSVGDLGWVDGDGYLHLADRRVDLIISGGANVYPAEVEAALSEHPGVEDVAVIGLPDDDLGKRVHAIVQVGATGAPCAAELEAHCTDRLARYKVPRSWELVERLPRDESGKLRRSALIAERAP